MTIRTQRVIKHLIHNLFDFNPTIINLEHYFPPQIAVFLFSKN